MVACQRGVGYVCIYRHGKSCALLFPRIALTWHLVDKKSESVNECNDPYEAEIPTAIRQAIIIAVCVMASPYLTLNHYVEPSMPGTSCLLGPLRLATNNRGHAAAAGECCCLVACFCCTSRASARASSSVLWSTYKNSKSK